MPCWGLKPKLIRMSNIHYKSFKFDQASSGLLAYDSCLVQVRNIYALRHGNKWTFSHSCLIYLEKLAKPGYHIAQIYLYICCYFHVWAPVPGFQVGNRMQGTHMLEVPHARSPIKKTIMALMLKRNKTCGNTYVLCRGPTGLKVEVPHARYPINQCLFIRFDLASIIKINGTCASMIIMWQAYARSSNYMSHWSC